jgi:hypothetical protein
MRGATLFTLCLVLLAPGVVAEEPGETPGVRVGVTVSRSFGDTRYELSAKAEDPTEPGTLTDIRSELTFPLEVTLLGVTGRWEPGMAASCRWGVAAGVHLNVTDPASTMTNEDWIGGRQISFTESNAELEMLLATAAVYYRFRQGQRSELSLVFHFNYRRVDQYLVGYEGWRASLFSDERFPVSGTAPVVDYKVEHLSPQLGAVGYYQCGDFSRLALQASSGLVYAWDRDDHLLRGRIAEGEGWGLGMNASLALDLLPGFVRLGWLFANLKGELRFFHAEGDVDQRWYRDEDLPAGTEIRDIPYQLESLQAQISLSVGVSF